MAKKKGTTGTIGVTTENIFPVIKKFLYSDHEIFLRELVANAVDATQKVKALASSGDFKYNRENETSIFSKRNEQKLHFFAPISLPQKHRLNAN